MHETPETRSAWQRPVLEPLDVASDTDGGRGAYFNETYHNNGNAYTTSVPGAAS